MIDTRGFSLILTSLFICLLGQIRSSQWLIFEVEALILLLLYDVWQWFGGLMLLVQKFLLQTLQHSVEVCQHAQGWYLVTDLYTDLFQPGNLSSPFPHLSVRYDGLHTIQLCEIKAEVFTDFSERLHVKR